MLGIVCPDGEKDMPVGFTMLTLKEEGLLIEYIFVLKTMYCLSGKEDPLFVIRDVLFMFKAPDHNGIEDRKKVASHI